MKSDQNEISVGRLRLLVTCLLLIGLVSGCGESGSETAADGPGHGITAGMTKAEVIEILGEPPKETAQSDSGNMVMLEYDNGLRVYLDEGKVLYVEELGGGSADRGEGESD